MYKAAILCSVLAFAPANAAPPQIAPVRAVLSYSHSEISEPLPIKTPQGPTAYVLSLKRVPGLNHQPSRLYLLFHHASDPVRAPNLLDPTGFFLGSGDYDVRAWDFDKGVQHAYLGPHIQRLDALHIEVRMTVKQAKVHHIGHQKNSEDSFVFDNLEAAVAVLPWSPLPGKPCDGVDRRLPAARKLALQKKIAVELKDPPLIVVQSFAFGGWNIVYVETDNSDPPFLFYRGDPLKTRIQTIWSGAAGVVEEEEIFDWTRENARGIPSQLARCFAFHVTKDRDQ